MIITSCPYCQEPIMTPISSMGTHKVEKCNDCDKVCWVEMTTLDGKTVTHEHFKENIAPEKDWDKVDAIAKDRSEREY